ncbi:MAG: protein kinase [Casimicrobiaceae bacterium]
MQPRNLNRYEVVSELGRGSMGVVYKATDPVIDRTVAIKTILLEEPGSETDAWRQRFYREAKSAGRLNHPNIVTIYDVGESGDVAYIAMEFLGGQSLREILDSGTVLPLEKIADIAAQVADGLAFAHQHGVVHRDIKPANIMVLDSGMVKITDFGIARLPTGTRTVAGTIFGSPKYISPERIKGLEVDGRSDIFSLGAVLYEMLTGFPPFFGGDLGAILHQVLEVAPAPPSSRNRNVPVGFDYIVAKALAKRPEDRYEDARDMAADLRNFLDLKVPMEAVYAAPPEPAGMAMPEVRDPTLHFDPVTFTPAPGAFAGLKAKMAGLARDPRMPIIVVSGAGAILLVALVSWALLPSLAARRDPSAVRTTVSAPAPAAIEDVKTAAVQDVPAREGAKGPAPVDAPARESTKSPGPGNVPARESTKGPAPVDGPARASIKGPEPAAETQLRSEPPVVVAQKTPAPEKPLLRVGLSVTPWGDVYVNGKKIGVAPPMTELRLAPGKYTIEIRNATSEPYRESIDLRDASNVTIRHRFQ